MLCCNCAVGAGPALSCDADSLTGTPTSAPFFAISAPLKRFILLI